MNKLLYVNIGGVVFQIDESAYQKLDNYLNSIRRKYNTSPDGDEIIKDIEHRIAELMFERVGERGAITENYVDEVITIMGKPEAFEEEASNYERTTYSEQFTRPGASKFFRDKDNNVLGGVCAGFGAKFGIDPLWLRLAFLAFFFAAGTGFLLYIILWVIIPEAKTTAEKLEMRNEKVDINNIEKTVKDGAKHFSSRVNEFGEEVKQTFSKENIDKTKRNAGDFIEDAAQTLRPFIQGIVKIFVFGALIISLMIVVVAGIELFSNWGADFTEIQFFGNHITEGTNQAWLLISCALALVLIPLLGIIYSSVKYLLGIKRKTKFVGNTLGFIWMGCLFVVIYLAITIGRNFKYEGNVSNKMSISQPANETLYVHLDEISALNDDNSIVSWSIKKDDFEDSVMFKHISVIFEKSLDTNFAVIVTKSARGYDRSNAKNNAQQLSYNIIQEGDSVVTIPSMIQLAENEKWREQEVDVLIRVPENKSVVIDSRLDYYLDKNEYTSDLKDVELYNNKLKMTISGLKPAI
jgi:phage shock protein PspC (stress-responsive transcriptional regulator)